MTVSTNYCHAQNLALINSKNELFLKNNQQKEQILKLTKEKATVVASSIKEYGVIQPVLVRPAAKGTNVTSIPD